MLYKSYASRQEVEAAAEERAEREQNRLDREFLRGGMTQGEYDAAVWALDQRVKRAVADWRR